MKMAEEIETEATSSTTTTTNSESSEKKSNLVPDSSQKLDPTQFPQFNGFAAENGGIPMFPIMNPAFIPGIFPSQQFPQFNGFAVPNGDMTMFPTMHPMFVPGIFPPQQVQEQMDRGAGIYAVPTLPFMGPVSGFPSNYLIPFTYNVPTSGPSVSENGTGGAEHGQGGQQQPLQQQQQAGQQRQVVVRRFQIAIHLDLLLILKLAAVIFLFNQDGSRQRLFLLIFFASLVYLYQTGALAPLVRWLSQGMQRAAAPPQQPRQAGRAENIPLAARQENENAPLAEGQVGAENENRAVGDGNQPVNEQENRAVNGNNRWWGIVKEIQLIVFGFITSLLPGFHNID